MCASLSSHGMWLGATSPSRPSPCNRAEWPSARLAEAGLSGAATAAATSRRLLSACWASLRCRGGCHGACCAGHLARPGPPPTVKLVEAWLCDSSLPSIADAVLTAYAGTPYDPQLPNPRRGRDKVGGGSRVEKVFAQASECFCYLWIASQYVALSTAHAHNRASAGSAAGRAEANMHAAAVATACEGIAASIT